MAEKFTPKTISLSESGCSVSQLFDYQKKFAAFVKDPGIGNKIKAMGDINIWDKIKFYNKFVVQQSLSFLRSGYDFKLMDSEAYINAYKTNNKEFLATASKAMMEACLYNYKQSLSINRDDDCVINFPDIEEHKQEMLSTFPELKVTFFAQNSKIK